MHRASIPIAVAGLLASPVAAVAPAPPGGVTSASSARIVVASAVGDTVTLVDDEGRRVRLARPARRIVSLVPALTEVLFAIGAGDAVVGRTRYDEHPPRVRGVPSVGDGVRPSAELVVTRRPDLVLLYAGAGNRGAGEELSRLGLPVLALRHDGLADLERNILRLGRATGRPARARALRDRIRARLEEVGRATADLPRRRVYYDVWGTPPMTIGAGSYLDSLLSVAGGRNVFGDLAVPSAPVGLEAIVARDPELILVPIGAGSRDRDLPAERPGWAAVGAVRRGAVRRVDGDLLHRLGPRIGDAAAALAAAIHPEAAGHLAAGAR